MPLVSGVRRDANSLKARTISSLFYAADGVEVLAHACPVRQRIRISLRRVPHDSNVSSRMMWLNWWRHGMTSSKAEQGAPAAADVRVTEEAPIGQFVRADLGA